MHISHRYNAAAHTPCVNDTPMTYVRSIAVAGCVRRSLPSVFHRLPYHRCHNRGAQSYLPKTVSVRFSTKRSNFHGGYGSIIFESFSHGDLDISPEAQLISKMSVFAQRPDQHFYALYTYTKSRKKQMICMHSFYQAEVEYVLDSSLAPHARCRDHKSHPTVGVALFETNVSDRLSSLSEESAVRMKLLFVSSF